jgi:hypothetical protein
VKDIGKPCAGKPHARFDEGGLAKAVMMRLFRHRQTKGTGTDKPNLKRQQPALYSTLYARSTTPGNLIATECFVSGSSDAMTMRFNYTRIAVISKRQNAAILNCLT